eukprot:GHVN01020505.1.p1 GENE.GHVN01020505.1~~GHVN01020505.1.p1  ORF type:complete len:232 (+),score=37.66 GHVN01020505.1:575-1270(+)
MSEASGNDVTTRKDGSAKPRKVAYVFYATRRTFLCQCMMAFKALKNAPRPTVRTPSLRAGVPELATALNFEIDYVLIYHHPERMDKYLLEQWVEMGGTLHEVKGLAWHWLWEDLADNDLKLYMYSLEDYERIIYLDTDALIFRHLDELFDPDVLSYHIFLAGAPLYWNSRVSSTSPPLYVTFLHSITKFNSSWKTNLTHHNHIVLLISLFLSPLSAFLTHLTLITHLFSTR